MSYLFGQNDGYRISLYVRLSSREDGCSAVYLIFEILPPPLPHELWRTKHWHILKVNNFFSSIAGTTKEHLGLAIALKIPFLIVVTKTDLCTKEQTDRTIQQLERILKSPGCKKVPILVENLQDAETAAASFSKQFVILLFCFCFLFLLWTLILFSF